VKAAVLAAGKGARLRPLTDSTPKCLVKVNGKPLLHNALEHLGGNGIDTAVIVIGHLGEMVRESLGEQFQGIRLIYVENRLFDTTSNAYSLWLARDHLNDDILLLEDDIFFEGELIDRVCGHSYANIVVADEYRDFMEGTGVNVDHDIVTEFVLKENAGQVVPQNPRLKTVNIYRFSRQFMETQLIPCLEQVIAEGHHDVFYEFALARVVKSASVRLAALPAAGLKWFEIDTPEDLQHAEQLFARQERRSAT
jgi:NDP-sugar pyrophosphorylase family protein